jgi:nucleotide-binding universal stress UspA family protein
MKKILCPTDFSNTAHNAIAFAAKFAQVTQSELVLFNVQSLFSLSPIELIKGKSDTIELVKEQLEAQSMEVARTFKISCYSEVQLSGVQLESIISANAKDFDLVIMGSDGENDLLQFLSGSHTYNLIRKVEIPVILIPADCSFNGMDLVVYSFDYLKEEKLPINQLSVWLELLRCNVRVLEVLEESVSLKQNKELSQLQGLIEETIQLPVKITFDTLHSSDVVDSINWYVLESKADMLALCSRHHSLLGRMFHKSVIKAISIQARYPVFVFHN